MPPVFVLPREDGQYNIDTGACDNQVWCGLLQEQKDKALRRVGYWSRLLRIAERRNGLTQKECLAVIWASLMLRPFLEGSYLSYKLPIEL